MTVNFDINHNEFEAQSDVDYETQTIEAQLEQRINERRVTMQPIRNLKN
jgi:hypothetical protein